MIDRFLLDTSAFIALTDLEPGHQRVAELVLLAEHEDIQLCASFVSLTEVQYNAEYDHGEEKARAIIARLKTLPIHWFHSDEALCAAAAEIKAKHKVSFADAFVVASAKLFDAVLVHKDPEMANLGNLIKQEVLPLKIASPQ